MLVCSRFAYFLTDVLLSLQRYDRLRWVPDWAREAAEAQARAAAALADVLAGREEELVARLVEAGVALEEARMLADADVNLKRLSYLSYGASAFDVAFADELEFSVLFKFAGGRDDYERVRDAVAVSRNASSVADVMAEAVSPVKAEAKVSCHDRILF